MTGWSISTEFYTSPPATYKGKDIPGVDFHYAIRRADGSLLFRTQKPEQAQEIVDALRVTHTEAWAA